MIPFSPPSYSRTRLALFGAALGLTALGCGTDAPPPDQSEENVEGDDEKDSDESDDGKPTNTKDAGKGGTTKVDAGAGKKDAGSQVATGADAGGGDKSPTTPAAGADLWCDALKVFEAKCQACHGAELAAGAPMALVTFADAIAPAPVTKGKKVYETVATRIRDDKSPMPPGKPLTAAEMAPIDAWIAAGATHDAKVTCEKKEEPKPATEDWPPAGCDAVYKLQAGNGSPVMVAKGAETHPQFVFDAPWGNEDVQALGFRPITDNKAVIHHWILYDNGGSGTFINGWAPGQDDTERRPLPDNVAMFVPKGPKSLRLDVHYNNLAGTKAEPDSSGVEICVTKKKRTNVAATFMGFAGIPFIAPGQETDIVGTCNVKVAKPVFLMAQSPHAHKLAKHMKLELKRAGKTTVLHDAPFAFDGQIATPFDEEVELKNGDQVVTTCHFKNDTNQLVTFGEDTGNEMCFNFATYYPMGALSCSGAAPIDIGSAFGGQPTTGG